MQKEKLKKGSIKPGDTLKNTRSGAVGVVLASEKNPKKLHERAHRDYVRVITDGKKRVRRTPWLIAHLEKVKN